MLDNKALDVIFKDARTYNHFEDKPVSDALLAQVYDLAKLAPTAANSSPARFLFVRSAEAKEKLKPALDAGNVDKTMIAPVTAIVAYDAEFYEKLPKLFPHVDAKSWFSGNPEWAAHNAFQSGTLQGAYFILAARSLGLDCGPMNGFNREKLDEAFFAGTSWKSNFLINLGYGKPDSFYPRSPRLDFAEACRVV